MTENIERQENAIEIANENAADKPAGEVAGKNEEAITLSEPELTADGQAVYTVSTKPSIRNKKWVPNIEKGKVYDTNPARLPNESYEDYKERRKIVGYLMKNYLRGEAVYNEATPYIKTKHGYFEHTKPQAKKIAERRFKKLQNNEQ